MRRDLLAAAACAALVAGPAFAQTDAPASTPPADPPAAAAPDSPTGATAETGAAADTATAAADAQLTPGAVVRDSTGADVGRILHVTPGSAGAEGTVTLSADGRTVDVPASSLSASGDALVSSSTRAAIWGPTDR
ncbi:MAG: hypothetical protein ACK41C_09500 [Phenylobacterium sp.]|uniref:hypothetical protein n=1 Tax=Phenylobacterium sp. TaxID=1871053 RepID=UPI00391C9CF2